VGRIGILPPAGGAVPESEFAALSSPGISIHAAPVPFGPRSATQRGRDPAASALTLEGARSFAESPKLEEATELLARMPLKAIAYCFTSSSYALGAAGDETLKARLEKQTQGIPVVITCMSAKLALHALGVQRLAIIHPPWFSVQLDRQGADYFRTAGFDVVYHAPAALEH
jgi:maleate isomerase